MDLDCINGTDSFAAAEFVAPGFVGHPAYVVSLVQEKNFFRTELNAGPAAGAQLLVNNHNLVHGLILSIKPVLMTHLSGGLGLYSLHSDNAFLQIKPIAAMAEVNTENKHTEKQESEKSRKIAMRDGRTRLFVPSTNPGGLDNHCSGNGENEQENNGRV